VNLWETLSECAADSGNPTGIAARYFAKAHDFTRTVWEGLENVEYRYASTQGDRPVDIDRRIAYSRALRKLMESDAEVHRLMSCVAHLVHPPQVVKRPDIVARALKIIEEGAPPSRGRIPYVLW
jgi:hypothetical protein